MKITKNALEGLYAKPKNHPVTVANPAPWKIDEVSIDHCYNCDIGNDFEVYIRNEKSMWFALSQCIIGEKKEFFEEI